LFFFAMENYGFAGKPSMKARPPTGTSWAWNSRRSHTPHELAPSGQTRHARSSSRNALDVRRHAAGCRSENILASVGCHWDLATGQITPAPSPRVEGTWRLGRGRSCPKHRMLHRTDPLSQRADSPEELKEKMSPRTSRRVGYTLPSARNTWKLGHNSASPSHMECPMSPNGTRLLTSTRGECSWNVDGAEDMHPAARHRFIKADAPSSPELLYFNDRKHLRPWQRRAESAEPELGRRSGSRQNQLGNDTPKMSSQVSLDLPRNCCGSAIDDLSVNESEHTNELGPRFPTPRMHHLPGRVANEVLNQRTKDPASDAFTFFQGANNSRRSFASSSEVFAACSDEVSVRQVPVCSVDLSENVACDLGAEAASVASSMRHVPVNADFSGRFEKMPVKPVPSRFQEVDTCSTASTATPLSSRRGRFTPTSATSSGCRTPRGTRAHLT